MPHYKKCLASIALLSCVVATPAGATSSAASSASDSVATSVGSISGSIQKSSASSSKATGVTAGDYKIIDVAAVADRPGTVRMTLQALADPSEDGELVLLLPQAAFDQSQLGQGQTVTALTRPYGVQFANAATQQAFFLVLSDESFRELQTRPVVL
jgi:hypothetical protein